MQSTALLTPSVQGTALLPCHLTVVQSEHLCSLRTLRAGHCDAVLYASIVLHRRKSAVLLPTRHVQGTALLSCQLAVLGRLLGYMSLAVQLQILDVSGGRLVQVRSCVRRLCENRTLHAPGGTAADPGCEWEGGD